MLLRQAPTRTQASTGRGSQLEPDTSHLPAASPAINTTLTRMQATLPMLQASITLHQVPDIWVWGIFILK